MGSSIRIFLTLSLSLFIGISTGGSAQGQTPGTLDPSFGVSGKVQTAVGTEDRGNAMVLQPDGKIVVAGKTRPGAVRFDFALARYNVDGSLDSNFGTAGRVITSLSTLASDDEAWALALQPNGKIIAVGSMRNTGGGLVATGVVRYNPDGSLDPSFGTGGIVLLERAVDRAVALQADGKIICGGGGGSSQLADYQITRLNRDGTPDSTFGSGGHVTIDFAGSGDGVYGLAVQPDGKIIAAGRSRLLGDDDNFAVARLNPDGSLDNTFGTGGKVATDFNSEADFGFAVALQPDAKIVVAGQARTGTNEWSFGLVRYNVDGTLDTTFGVDGRVRTDFGIVDSANAIKLQPNGKIVAAGLIGPGGFALARYNPDGSLDSTFSGTGKTTVFFEGIDEGRAVVVQPDGKIVVAGTANGGGIIGQFALARFFGDPFLSETGSISGRAFASDGAPLRYATISIIDSAGISRYAQTNPFGYFRFLNLPLGAQYTMIVASKRHNVIAPPIVVSGNMQVDLLEEQ